jgi:integrase
MNYKTAKIFYGKKNGKDIKKEWFVYFSYLNPTTGKFQRFKEFKGINRFHTIKERTEHALMLQEAINIELKNGFNPFSLAEDPFTKNFSEALDYALSKKSMSVSDRTNIEYKSQLKFIKDAIKHCYLDEVPITQIKRANIKQVLYWLQANKSTNTYNKYLLVLKTLFSVLVEDELIEFSPVHGIKAQKKHETPGYVSFDAKTKETVRNLMYADSFAFGLIGETIYETGIRPNEVLSLKWENINYDELTITVPGISSKNNKIRIVPVKQSLIDKYKRHELDNNCPKTWYIFSDKLTFESGEIKLHRNRLSDRWHEVIHEQGLPSNLKLYGLKHTGADDKIMAGISLDYLKELYGHHSTKMTRIYAKKITQKAGEVIRKDAPDF